MFGKGDVLRLKDSLNVTPNPLFKGFSWPSLTFFSFFLNNPTIPILSLCGMYLKERASICKNSSDISHKPDHISDQFSKALVCLLLH